METSHVGERVDERQPEMADDDPAGAVHAREATDDVVLLAWWQHPLNILTMLVATALIAGMLGWLIHDESSEPGGNAVDVGFLQDMRLHHDQAVQLGYIFLDRPDTDPRLQTVARSIVLGQGIDIGRMIQLLRQLDAPEIPETDMVMRWMGMEMPMDEMPGMASDAELAAATGADADRLFVELMTTHHRGGLEMAEYAAREGGNEEVRSMAAAILDSQRHEIAELEGLAG